MSSLTLRWINPLRRRSAPAKALRTSAFRQRVVEDKKRALKRKWARNPER